MQQAHRVKKEVAQLVTVLHPVGADAPQVHAADAVGDLVGLLVQGALYLELRPPAADDLGQQLQGPLGGELPGVNVTDEEGIQIGVAPAPVGLVVHGVFQGLHQAHQHHALQRLMEAAGGVGGDVVTGFRDGHKLLFSGGVTLSGGFLPGEVGIALRQGEGSVADDDGRLPEEVFFHLLGLVLQEIVDVRLGFGAVREDALIQDLVEVEGVGAVAEVPAGEVGVLQMGVHHVPRPIPQHLRKHLVHAVHGILVAEGTGGLPQDLQVLMGDAGLVMEGALDAVLAPKTVQIVAHDVDLGIVAHHAGPDAAHDEVKVQDADVHVFGDLLHHLRPSELQVLPLGLLPGFGGVFLAVGKQGIGGVPDGFLPALPALVQDGFVDLFQKLLLDRSDREHKRTPPLKMLFAVIKVASRRFIAKAVVAVGPPVMIALAVIGPFRRRITQRRE